ncbi:MAG: hypothetical protein ABSF82_12050 [Candidatus Bathyarchaeia archaeon]
MKGKVTNKPYFTEMADYESDKNEWVCKQCKNRRWTNHRAVHEILKLMEDHWKEKHPQQYDELTKDQENAVSKPPQST